MQVVLGRSLITCLFFFLLSCSDQEHANQALRVGMHKWIGYETLTIAEELGAYQDANLRLVRLVSASDLMHAIRSENLEAATLTLDETLILISEGFELDVLAVIDYSMGGDAVIAKEPINQLSDLKGKTIAVEFVAVGAIMLDALLDAAQLTLDDVTVIPCTIDQHTECFKSADAVITFEPYRTQLIEMGGKVIFDSSAIPERIVDVLAVKRSAIAPHKKAIQTLVNGYCQAQRYSKSNYEETRRIVSRSLGVSPDNVDQAYKLVKIPDIEENINLLSSNPSKLDEAARSLASFMQKRSLLKEVKVARLANDLFIQGCKHGA